MILAVVNEKGGVAKTTTAVNIAAAWAARGRRVLLIDLDSQASASSLVNVRAVESMFDVLSPPHLALGSVIVSTPIDNLWLAPAHRALAGLDGAMGYGLGKPFRLQKLLKPLRESGAYDDIVIDTAPAPLFSPSGIAAGMALVAADVALIPLQVEELAVNGLGQVMAPIAEAQDESLNPALQVRIVLTMADGRRSDTRDIEDKARARFGRAVCQTVIPRLAEISRGLRNREVGGAIVTYAAKTPGALAYCALADEVACG